MDTSPGTLDQDDHTVELDALAAAVAESDADPRTVAHDEMHAWLQKVAASHFDSDMPAAR